MNHTNELNREPSDNRQKLLDFIVAHMTENNGTPPTLAQMCEALDVSKPTIMHHRRKLVNDGFIEVVDGKVSLPGSVKNDSFHIPSNANGRPSLLEHQNILSDQDVDSLNVQVVELEDMGDFEGEPTAVVTDNDSYKIKAIELGFSVYTIKQVQLQMEVK